MSGRARFMQSGVTMEYPASGFPRPVHVDTTAEMLAALPPALVQVDAVTAEPRLAEVLGLYRSVFLNSIEAIAIVDLSGHYLEQNVAHEMLLGYSAGELAGMSPAVHMGPEAFATIIDDLTRVGASRREVVSRTRDGRELVIDLSAFTVRDRNGAPVCYVGIKRDVTAQRRATEELNRHLAELRVVYAIAESLARARSPEQIFEEAIDALRSVLAADRASVLLFDGDQMRFRAWRGLSDAYRAAVEGHSPWRRDEVDPQPIAIADVAAAPALQALRPVIDAEGIRALAFVPLVDEGRLLGKFMIYFDRPHAWTDSELRLASTIAHHVAFAVVRHQREKALGEANRAKSLFLATMSHELRTPLNAIAGYTDLLDAGIHGPLTPSQADALQRIQVNQRHLLQLIDDVLDFAKLEAGHLHFDIADVPVQETLASTCALIETQLAAKHVRFEFAPGDARVTCRGDRARIQQIVANLLSNAWKFTPPGGTVRLWWAVEGSQVRVHVSDTGEGIAESSLEAVFAPFVQLHAGFRRRVEGTGLGLAISRELARGMGGDIVASSRLGEGSTFTLVMPHSSA